MSRQIKSVAVAAAALTALTGLAGCGGSSSSSAAGTGGGGGSTDAGVVSAAKAALTKDTALPTFTPGESIDVSKLQGKTVAVIAHDQTSDELVEILQGAQQAGQAAGVKVLAFNGDKDVTKIQQYFTQAINQHVGAIVVDGIDPKVISGSLKDAATAKIPVIAAMNSPIDTSAPGQGAGEGFAANAEPPNYQLGKLIVDKAIADSNGAVKAAIITFDNAVGKSAQQGMNDELAKCGGCKVLQTVTIEPGDWPTKVSPEVQSLVRAHPDLNYVLVAADTMGIFATTGVKIAMKTGKVHVLGVDGSADAPLSLVKDGSIFAADPGSSPAWIGWAAMDQAYRAMLGVKPADPTVPYRWIDTAQLANANTKDFSTVYGTAYVDGYKAEWGVNG
jgi:ribose transport system substrate-binding protein